MRRRLITLSLAGVILLAGATAVAAQEPTAGEQTGSAQNEDGFPWGLLGLLGLAGLAGLNKGRRDDHDRVTR